ncbi:MAG: hypothetical protein J6U54_08695 [Clostridiales bacterium]|nr:hypothetical protein [Clostridiales bacterium]
MKIAIIARSVYCRRILEFLKFSAEGTYEFTGTKYYGHNEVAVFIFESTEEAEVINTEIWIKGNFLNDDVITLRFANDLPMLE